MSDWQHSDEIRILKQIDQKLGHIIILLQSQNKEFIKDMAALDDQITALTTEVANNTTVEASAEALIAGIPGMITTAVNAALAAGATPAQLTALTNLTAALVANDGTLNAAVVAQTPAAPPNSAPVPAIVKSGN